MSKIERAQKGRPLLPAEGTAGQAIRAYRERSGVTLEELADKVGMTKSGISAIERGKSSPTMKTLERIAEGLDADLSVILKRQRRDAA